MRSAERDRRSLKIELLDYGQALPDAVKHRKAGTKGVYEGRDPHSVGAAEIAADIWETLRDNVIRKC